MQLGDRLPGTETLDGADDLAERMVAGIGGWLAAELERADAAWAPPPAGADPEAGRAELARRIGAADPRLPVTALELVGSSAAPSLLGAAEGFEVHAVRWPVLEGVDGEGLLLRPLGPVRCHVVALPDADWAPEAVAGLTAALPPAAQFARSLAERGCQVVVPVLVDRGGCWAGGRPHREYVWRMAFELGRHIIGYEVQKVRALVDFFTGAGAEGGLPVGVWGYGEGGLIALHAAALDTRLAAAGVSGYFRRRQEPWREPIYRDVWGQWHARFSDEGLAALVRPRGLVVEVVPGPDGGHPASGGPGAPLPPVPSAEAWAAASRVLRAYGARRSGGRFTMVEPLPGDPLDPGTPEALTAFLESLGLPDAGPQAPGGAPVLLSPGPDPQARLHRQFRQLCAHGQALLRASEGVRRRRWAGADRSSPAAWAASTAPHAAHLAAEVIGRCPQPTLPPSPRSRLVYERPGFRGYELTLDLWPGVFASGLLLLPGDLRSGERRPVVVCQHGLEGRARDTVEGPADSPYRAYAARLAERGFIVYAPQNPYVGGEAFRVLQRKAHPLQLSLFSFIVAQHRRTLEWLAGLPCVDPERIALYGLSYGGKTAMRVPALLPGYCLSICSADFNEWVYKCAGEDPRISYLNTPEYDMYEFDLAHTCNYAELAGLIAPRPFMVERGHRDPVGLDEWVAFEYAKVRRLYADLGIPERTAIEFFAGGHWIHGQGTFEFLLRHLGDPRAGTEGQAGPAGNAAGG